MFLQYEQAVRKRCPIFTFINNKIFQKMYGFSKISKYYL